MERGKSEERPAAFHLYLSIFHFGQIKGEAWEKLDQQLVLPFAPKPKTKRTLSGGHLRLVAIWDLPWKLSSFESIEYTGPSGMLMLRDLVSNFPKLQIASSSPISHIEWF